MRHLGVFSALGDTMSTSEDTTSTLGDIISTSGVYHEYIGDVQYIRGI